MIIYSLVMLKKTIPAFVQKTWNLLQSGQFAEVIGWNEQGDAFRIQNDHDFEHTVLPAYFKHSNLTSFQRQLNMYNFHKRKLENGQTEYYHRLFKKHQRELLLAIRRKPSEDQIEIGEELLRRLALEHEEVPQGNEPRKERRGVGIDSGNDEKGGGEKGEEGVGAAGRVQNGQKLEVSQLGYNAVSYPYAYYYMANAYPLSEVVSWCPQKKIKTYVLVQSPIKQGQGVC